MSVIDRYAVKSRFTRVTTGCSFHRLFSACFHVFWLAVCVCASSLRVFDAYLAMQLMPIPFYFDSSCTVPFNRSCSGPLDFVPITSLSLQSHLTASTFNAHRYFDLGHALLSLFERFDFGPAWFLVTIDASTLFGNHLLSPLTLRLQSRIIFH